MEWYEQGYWKLNDIKETAIQYLGLQQGYKPVDGTLPLNEGFEEDTIWWCEDRHNKTQNKTITLDQFMNRKIDIVIASIPAHIKPFKELAAMKGAKFILQMGNVFPEVDLREIPNLMANTLPDNVPCHHIQYHQEFDLNIFKPSSLSPKKKITSLINIYQINKGFNDYVELKGLMPDWDFKSYGGQCVDGTIGTTEEMARVMQESAWGFHSKYQGDGYGHVLYNWFACGKPIITRISDYKDKLGGELLEDGVTCIDIDKHNYNEIQYNISNMPPMQYEYMCQQVYQRFTDKVNFDQEELKIRKFLEELI